MVESKDNDQLLKAEVTRLLGENYQVGEIIASTRTSIALSSSHLSEKREEVIWCSRYPLEQGTEGELSKRLRTCEQLTFSPAHYGYGVDSERRPYVLQQQLQATNLAKMPAYPAERMGEVAFEVTKALAQVHYLGCVLGDVCLDSFFVDDEQRIWLASIIGPVPEPVQARFSKQACYLAPEVLAGHPHSKAGDIYSLGVCLYRLATTCFPCGETSDPAKLGRDLSEIIPPTKLAPTLPKWFDAFIGKCLIVDPTQRFGDAYEALDFISKAEIDILSASASDESLWKEKTIKSYSAEEAEVANRFAQNAAVTGPRLAERESGEKKKPGVLFVTMMLAIVVVVLSAALAVRYLLVTYRTDLREISFSFGSFLESPDPDLKALVRDLVRRDTSDDYRKEILTKIAAKTSISVEPVLVGAAKGELGPEASSIALNLIAERMKSRGLLLTAGLFSSWVTKLRETGRDPGREYNLFFLVKAADISESADERKKAIYALYSKEEEFGLQYACALAIDQEASGVFFEPFKEIVSLKYPSLRFAGVALPAVVLGVHEPSLMFGGIMMPRLVDLKDSDLLWLLKRDTIREFSNFYKLAGIVSSRQLIDPERKVFFEMLDPKYPSVAPNVLDALVAGSLGMSTVQTVISLSNWYFPRQQSLIIRMCVIEPDPAVVAAAFDRIQLRSIKIEPIISIVDWIRRNAFKDRALYAKSVGVLAEPELYSKEQIENSFDKISEVMEPKELFEASLKSSNNSLVFLAIDRFGGKADPQTIVPFLKAEDPQVRVAAVKSLRGIVLNETKQLLTKRYSQETDETVREAYRQYHSYLR